nr:copper chaperone PCu(A)C [Microbacterium halimionae]
MLAAAALALTGCASTGDTATAESAAPAGDVVAISDAWVKAADSGMSAAFGELTNEGTADATIVSISSDASTSLQLHETVENDSGDMVMQEKDGGFVIPAGGTFTLEPGGNHFMLMDLTDPLVAGDDVSFTVTFSDDSTYEFTAPVKDYSGANENYEDSDMDMGTDSDMDMGN